MTDRDWTKVIEQAARCRKTWGMGFPVISVALLEPLWLAAMQEARNQAIEQAANLVESWDWPESDATAAAIRRLKTGIRL